MSDFTDDTLGRWLDQQPDARDALLYEPVQRAQAEHLRRTLAAVERAMADEGVADDVRRQVINRVVWGEPEGRIDVHAKARLEREEMLSAYALLSSMTGVWAPIHDDGTDQAQPNEESTS